MATVRELTRWRRKKMLKMRHGTVGFAEERLPLKRQVVHKICSGVYSTDGVHASEACTCSKAPEKPACERMEGVAQHIIDLVRRYDLRQRES